MRPIAAKRLMFALVALLSACLCSVPMRATAVVAAADKANTAVPRSYTTANGLLHRGLYDLSAAEFRQFLTAHPKHEKATIARYGLAVCLFRLDKLEAAAEELSRLQALRGFAYEVEVATMLGQCHLAGNRYDAAIRAFGTVIDKQPDHPLADDAASQLVEALYRNGRLEDATKCCDTFESRWPDSMHRDRADYFGGLAAMKQQAHTTGISLFAGLLKMHPESPFAAHAALLLAQCYHRGGDLKAASRQYREVLSQADSPYIPDALLGQATLLRHQNLPEKAGSLLDRLLEQHAESSLAPAAWLARGRVGFDLGKYDAASKAFRRAMKETRGPQAAEAAYWSAKCKLRLGEHARAARDLDKAIARYPDCDLLPEMYYDRAVALLRNGDLDAAANGFAEFRDRYPRHTLAAGALQSLASITHQQGNFGQSRKHALAFLKQYPEHDLAAQVAFLVAENEYLAGNMKKAAVAYRRFLDRYQSAPNVATEKYRLGISLYRLGEFEQAEPLLADTAANKPDGESFHAVHLALGDIHFRRGEWKPSEQHLRAYLSKGLKVAAADDALLKLALVLQRQEQHEQAIELHDRLLKSFNKSPHRLQARFERGQALLALGHFDEAAQAFEQVLARNRDSRFAVPARRHLANISLRKGEYTEAADRFAGVARATGSADESAEATFQQGKALVMAKDFPAAEEAFKRLIDRFPTFARLDAARANLAIAIARQDKHEAAIELMKKVNASKLDSSLLASVRYEKAWCLRALGRKDEAAKAYRKLIGNEAGGEYGAHALLELAGIEAGDGRYDAAIKLLRQLRGSRNRLDKSAVSSLTEQADYQLGTCLFKTGQYEEAAKVLEDCTARQGEVKLCRSAEFFCGEALFALGKHKQAVRHFEHAVADAKSGPEFGPSLLRLGECHAALQHWAQSEEYFYQYLEHFERGTQASQARFGVGWARENQGRLDEAIRAYERVVADHNGETAARAQFQIGQCLFAKKEYDRAARALLKVDILYAYPQWSAAALYEAGRCFEKLSKTAEARQQFTTVSEQYKDTQWATLASARLTALANPKLPGR